MVHAHARGWRPGRMALVLGGMFLAGLLTLQAAAPRKGPASREPSASPPAPAPLRMVIASKDSDVAEMTKLINTRLEEGWKANKIVPSAYADDYTFLRRASLDIIGRVATPREIRDYLRDPPQSRRSLLIERLLDSEEYPRHWATLWSNWLLTRSGPFGRGLYKEQMTVWLEDQFAQNRPYSEMVQKLITAKGRNSETDPKKSDGGAVNFILAHVGERVPPADQKRYGHFDMIPLTSRITRLFLGTQVQCAQCHDHPFFSDLKQEQFWGVNAFLRQVDREGNPPGVGMVMNRPGPLTLVDDPTVNVNGVISFEKRNGVVLSTRARFLPSGEDKEAQGPRLELGEDAAPRREQLARFVLEHDRFPKAYVNRMWGVFLGRGFANPVDDFNDNNQPSNPELLDELAAKVKHYNYDQKKLIRWICNSNAYHLSCVANRTNDKPEQEALFSRMVLKSMSPEQLFDSLMIATNAEALENSKDKTKLRDQWLSRLIAGFGDDEGNEVNFNGTVVQALLMMNGEDINKAISRPQKGTVALAVAHSRTPTGLLRDLYLAALNREPTPQEINAILSKFPLRTGYQRYDTWPTRAQDLFWALLNSNEFILNH